MVRPHSPSPGTPRARATVYVPSVHVAIAVGDGPITTEYVADARARIQASTKAVLEITDPSKYAVTDTARKTLEGRKLFVINADTDMPAMTSARADRFLKICFDPDAPIPKPKNQGDLEKVMKDTHGQYFVTVVQVSSASEQIFFLRAINKESNFVYIACSCGDFVTSANICAEAVAVAAEVGVIDLEVQLTKMQPRRAAGRPGNEDKGWYDRTLGGRKRDAAWFLKVIRQNAPFYFYKWNVMRVFGGANWVGYVADFRDFGKGSGPRWHVVYDRAPNEPEDIVDTELSAALHLAVEMGVGGPRFDMSQPAAAPPSAMPAVPASLATWRRLFDPSSKHHYYRPIKDGCDGAAQWAYPSAGIIECNDDGTGDPSCTFYMDATTQKTWWPEGPVGSGGGCSGGEVDTRSENVPAEAGASVSTAAPSAVAGVPPVEAAVATSEVAGVAPALEALASVATAASTEAAEATRQCAYAAPGHCKGIGMLVKCQGSSGRPCPSGALMHHLCQVEFMDAHGVKEDSAAERKECIECLGARHAKEVRAQTNPKRSARLKGTQ